jgi:hypothetical protein
LKSDKATPHVTLQLRSYAANCTSHVTINEEFVPGQGQKAKKSRISYIKRTKKMNERTNELMDITKLFFFQWLDSPLGA